jgi:iron complex transport system substrate-binding protein
VIHRFCQSLTGLSLLCASALLWSPAFAKPSRIISLNLCADELVLRLVPAHRIQAVSFLARDPDLSSVTRQAAKVRAIHGSVEDILPLSPDLVIIGRWSTPATRRFLRAKRAPLLEVDTPQSIDAALALTRNVAHALGEAAKGEALVREMEAARLAPRQGPPLLVAVFGPNGYSAGTDGLATDVVRAAGLRNLGGEIGLDPAGRLSLEAIVWHRPDVVLVSDRPKSGRSRADQIVQHPALARATRTVTLTDASWSCPGPQLAMALRRLKAL